MLAISDSQQREHDMADGTPGDGLDNGKPTTFGPMPIVDWPKGCLPPRDPFCKDDLSKRYDELLKKAEQEKLDKMAKEIATPTPTDPWAHRSENMRCRTCMWFVAKSGELGRCRKHAPTISGFPAVYLSDWCGDHKLDETKAG